MISVAPTLGGGCGNRTRDGLAPPLGVQSPCIAARHRDTLPSTSYGNDRAGERKDPSLFPSAWVPSGRGLEVRRLLRSRLAVARKEPVRGSAFPDGLTISHSFKPYKPLSGFVKRRRMEI